jgi:hypothetical protein
MGQEVSKEGEIDIQALWKEEDKLSTKERRKRYKCKEKYVTVDKIPIWENISEDTLKEGESTV